MKHPVARLMGPCLAVILGVGASPGLAQPEGIVDCTGPFARDADEGAFSKTFGPANVDRGDIYVGEGSTETGTVIFAGNHAKRIEILWHDSANRRRPKVVLFRDGSTWRVPANREIGIGATLADVEAANGTPFTILGFGWDNGGYAGGWRGGALERLADGCSLSLNFDPGPDASPSALDKTNGDIEFLSSDPAMRASKPVVSLMRVSWPE